jgi:hypothetical protein
MSNGAGQREAAEGGEERQEMRKEKQPRVVEKRKIG